MGDEWAPPDRACNNKATGKPRPVKEKVNLWGCNEERNVNGKESKDKKKARVRTMRIVIWFESKVETKGTKGKRHKKYGNG